MTRPSPGYPIQSSVYTTYSRAHRRLLVGMLSHAHAPRRSQDEDEIDEAHDPGQQVKTHDGHRLSGDAVLHLAHGPRDRHNDCQRRDHHGAELPVRPPDGRRSAEPSGTCHDLHRSGADEQEPQVSVVVQDREVDVVGHPLHVERVEAPLAGAQVLQRCWHKAQLCLALTRRGENSAKKPVGSVVHCCICPQG
eukprot:CAMPEP_0175327186 /NCGR_PEP_ID=MMETSP0093-20121207/74911_1 /TAXON_ID=311494 /ORGANISM="Alexandrium monilatum, Strain CCMP3105" /LENGTH=192 /DNA_ID=CAMNT_0016624199 /DNA_START=315 /DNA_END=889 /DNA_ORIENTATION=-